MKRINKSAMCCIVVANITSIFLVLFLLSAIRGTIVRYYIIEWAVLAWVVVSAMFLAGWIVEWTWKARRNEAAAGAVPVPVSITQPRSPEAEDGYDIIGPGTLELCTSASSFAAMRDHGYDCFQLIGAVELDVRGKGKGSCQYVPASSLGAALRELEHVAPEDCLPLVDDDVEWTREKEMENPFRFWAAPLAAFMRGCLEWCAESGQDRVKIEFT